MQDYYYLPFNDLAEFYHIPVDQLKEKSYNELEQLTTKMTEEKTNEETKRTANDEEYRRLIKKYFTPYEFLSKYFTDVEIFIACSHHVPEQKLVSEYAVRKGNHCPYPDAEYISTGQHSLPRYTKSGERLVESEWTICDIYRIRNQYQGTSHGKVIKELLYAKYPQLREFNFSAYEYSPHSPYEIYPANHIYTPFEALMNKDIDAIIERNRKYAKAYNHGICTPENTEARLASDKVKHYFDVIRNL